jgi:hypothetical protein
MLPTIQPIMRIRAFFLRTGSRCGGRVKKLTHHVDKWVFILAGAVLVFSALAYESYCMARADATERRLLVEVGA